MKKAILLILLAVILTACSNTGIVVESSTTIPDDIPPIESSNSINIWSRTDEIAGMLIKEIEHDLWCDGRFSFAWGIQHQNDVQAGVYESDDVNYKDYFVLPVLLGEGIGHYIAYGLSCDAEGEVESVITITNREYEVLLEEITSRLNARLIAEVHLGDITPEQPPLDVISEHDIGSISASISEFLSGYSDGYDVYVAKLASKTYYDVAIVLNGTIEGYRYIYKSDTNGYELELFESDLIMITYAVDEGSVNQANNPIYMKQSDDNSDSYYAKRIIEVGVKQQY